MNSAHLERNQMGINVTAGTLTSFNHDDAEGLQSGGITLERGLGERSTIYATLSHQEGGNDADTRNSRSERITLGTRSFPFKWSSIKPFTNIELTYAFEEFGSDQLIFDVGAGVLFPINEHTHFEFGTKTNSIEYEDSPFGSSRGDYGWMVFAGFGYSF